MIQEELCCPVCSRGMDVRNKYCSLSCFKIGASKEDLESFELKMKRL